MSIPAIGARFVRKAITDEHDPYNALEIVGAFPLSETEFEAVFAPRNGFGASFGAAIEDVCRDYSPVMKRVVRADAWATT